MDLYTRSPKEAKRDPRLRESGSLDHFEWAGKTWPLVPRTAFYDWLYLRALSRLDEGLRDQLHDYSGFTDIGFNPKRSINCQARACALYVALTGRGHELETLAKPASYRRIIADQDSLF